MRNIILLSLLLLTGCSLVMPGNFEEDVARDNKFHKERYDSWLQKKGITEHTLIGMTKEAVRAKIGNPDRVLYDWDGGFCQQKMKKREEIGDECKGESWTYTNLYGIPFLSSGFAQYSVEFNKYGIVDKFYGYREM